MSPYIHTFQRDNRWSGVFAVLMESCPAERPGQESEESMLKRHLRLQMDFVNTLFHTDPKRTYALRIITQPHSKIFSAGEILLVLLCRVDASDEKTARSQATSLAKEMAILLGGAMPDQQWVIIKEQAAFAALWEPFPTPKVYIQEIRRREAYINLETHHPRSKIGFAADIPTPANEDETTSVYFVNQFLPNPTSLARLLRTMLLHEAPLVYQAAISPAELTSAEKAELNSSISKCEQASTRKPRVDKDKAAAATEASLHQTDALAYGLIEEMLRLQDAPFQMQVMLASPVPLPPSLVEAAGVEITKPISNRLVSGGRASSPVDLQGGGYDAVEPAGSSERKTAAENFRFLELNPWGRTLAPKGCERFRQLVDASEATSAFRFPIAMVDGVTGLNLRISRSRPIPREIAVLASRKTGKFQIGQNNYMGQHQPVFLSEPDRLQHTYVMGQTGTGKTTLLKTMILQDIEAGRGVAVIDPHGDLFRELLHHIPANRIQDVVILDPTDAEFPVGLNLLECKGDEDRYFVVREFRGIMERLLADQYGINRGDMTGPAFYQHMQMNLMLAMSNPDKPGTLLEFYNIFQSKTYWKRWLPLKWSDSRLRTWVGQNLPNIDYLKRGSENHATWGEYLSSKFEDFIFDPKLRVIFGQRHSTIRIHEIMDEGKILLVNLAKGQLAEPNARFLGMVLLAKIQAAAMARSHITKAKRRPFYLYVDEFQSVATENFVMLLSEARKFGVSLTLANQFLSQVKDKRIQQAISGNVGTQICFRVGREDAELIEPQFAPFFDKYDLTNLHNRNAYVRTTVEGKSVNPFTLETTLPPQPTTEATGQDIIRASRLKYGRAKLEIERELTANLEPSVDALSKLIHQVHGEAKQSIQQCCQLLELDSKNSSDGAATKSSPKQDEKLNSVAGVVEAWLANCKELEKLVAPANNDNHKNESPLLEKFPALKKEFAAGFDLKVAKKIDMQLRSRLRVRADSNTSLEDVLVKIRANDARICFAEEIVRKELSQPLPKVAGS